MKIRGRLVASDQFPVAIVSAGTKQIGVAVIVAGYPDGPYDNHPFTSACFDLLGSAANANGLFGTLLKVEIATRVGAAARVEMSLVCADDGDVIVFMCADAAIFDIAWRALNVRKAA